MVKSTSKKEKTPETKTFKLQAEIPGDLTKALRSCKPSTNINCGGIYGVGLFGALIYFISHATTISGGIFGIIKAILWPAFVVHALLGFLGL